MSIYSIRVLRKFCLERISSNLKVSKTKILTFITWLMKEIEKLILGKKRKKERKQKEKQMKKVKALNGEDPSISVDIGEVTQGHSTGAGDDDEEEGEEEGEEEESSSSSSEETKELNNSPTRKKKERSENND